MTEISSARTPFTARVVDVLTDAAALAGAGLVIEGAAQIYAPAGFIVAGGFLLGAAWLAARRATS